MKFNKQIFIIGIIASMGILYSCLKTSTSTEKELYNQDLSFFQRNIDVPSLFADANSGVSVNDNDLNRVINEFKEVDFRNHIVEAIKSKYGFAEWDLGIGFKNKNGLKTIIIPIIDKQDNVNAILVSYQKNNLQTAYTIYKKGVEYKNLNQFGNREATIFTNSSLQGIFKLSKERHDNLITIKKAGSATANRNSSFTCMCWSYNWAYHLEDGTVVVGATIPQCNCTVGIDNELEVPDAGPLGGNQQPVYIYINSASPNQNIIDSLRGYPCAQNVLGEMSGLNQQIDSILNKVFGVNSDVNITFSVNSTLNDSVVAQTTIANGSLSNFNASIQLNPKYLTGSKEYIASAILHETVHAYIYYMRNYYGSDTTSFKNLFPIYWDFRGNAAQHNQMANNYVQYIAGVLMSLNSNLSSDVANALAWRGLAMTEVWKSKSQTEKDYIIDINSRTCTPTSGTVDSLKIRRCN